LVAKAALSEHLRPGTHAATFGGNPLACRAAVAAIETIEADGLLARAVQLEARFRQRFEALKARCPLVKQVRVKGVMVGVELTIEGAPLVDECLKRKLLINCTHGTVLRLLPALNLTDQQLEEGCTILEEVITAKAS